MPKVCNPCGDFMFFGGVDPYLPLGYTMSWWKVAATPSLSLSLALSVVVSEGHYFLISSNFFSKAGIRQ
jgi:hypothetical protein